MLSRLTIGFAFAAIAVPGWSYAQDATTPAKPTFFEEERRVDNGFETSFLSDALGAVSDPGQAMESRGGPSTGSDAGSGVGVGGRGSVSITPAQPGGTSPASLGGIIPPAVGGGLGGVFVSPPRR